MNVVIIFKILTMNFTRNFVTVENETFKELHIILKYSR